MSTLRFESRKGWRAAIGETGDGTWYLIRSNGSCLGGLRPGIMSDLEFGTKEEALKAMRDFFAEFDPEPDAAPGAEPECERCRGIGKVRNVSDDGDCSVCAVKKD